MKLACDLAVAWAEAARSASVREHDQADGGVGKREVTDDLGLGQADFARGKGYGR
jgi:hypothetical protein